MEFNGYVGLLICSASVSIAFAWISWNRRKIHPTFAWLMVLMLGLAWWSAAYALQCASTSLHRMVFFDLLIYPGVVVVPGSFFAIVQTFTGKDGHLRRRTVALLAIEPMLALLAVVSNPATHLFIRNAHIVGHDPIGLGWTGGPLFFVHTAYSYALLGFAGLMLLRYSLQMKGMFRRQGIATLCCAVVPWGVNVVFNLHLVNIGPFDPTPLAFCCTGIGTGWALFKVRVGDLVPVARDLLVETMTDVVVVIDIKARVIDLNPAAHRLFDIPLLASGTNVIGKRVDELLGGWTEPLLLEPPPESWLAKAGDVILDVRVTRFATKRGLTPGHLVLARDVTDFQRAQDDLKEQIAANARLQGELQELSVRDPLTGMYNRRYMDVALNEELTVSVGSGVPLSVVLIDVDHFKEVNDTLGHSGGDSALRELSDVLQGQMRGDDVCCRLGGDEFIVILPNTSRSAAEKRANQWRDVYTLLNLNRGDGLQNRPFSAGVATSPEDGSDIDSLLAAADNAMYSAKRNGRNQIAIA